MATNEERLKEVNEQIDSMNKSLMEKSPLRLTVEIPTVEAAEEIMAWMYSEERSPMKHARLRSIDWDMAAVSKQEAEAVRMIREGDAYVGPEDMNKV